MNYEQLKSKFPNASAAFLAANCDDNTREPAVPKSRAGRWLVAAAAHEKRSAAKVLVRVTDVRTRLIDTDNLFAKWHIDCLRNARIIPGDAPDQATIQVAQRKVFPGEVPHTEITIELEEEKSRARQSV